MPIPPSQTPIAASKPTSTASWSSAWYSHGSSRGPCTAGQWAIPPTPAAWNAGHSTTHNTYMCCAACALRMRRRARAHAVPARTAPRCAYMVYILWVVLAVQVGRGSHHPTGTAALLLMMMSMLSTWHTCLQLHQHAAPKCIAVATGC